MSSPTSFRDTIARQRMIRPPYQDRPVARSLIEQLVADSQKAPSAGFSQGASFLVLEGEAVRGFWDTTLPGDSGATADDLLPCPVIVLPLENPQAYLERYSKPDKARWGLQTADAWPVPYWTVDTAFAAMVLLLSATASGLGAWFFGIFSGEQELLRTLGVPAGTRPIGAIALGYPREGTPVSTGLRDRRRPLDEVLSWAQG